MITAVFTDNSDYARATGLWQWDYGQRLRIEGLKLPTAVEIHFALTEQSGDSNTRVGTTKDGVTEVVIPDSMLENQAAGATYEIYAWIYLADKTFGETIKRISMQVKRRPKPEGFDTPEDAELFREAIEAVNASADRAETAREGAEAAQEAAEAAAGKIEGEITGAGQIAEQVKQDAAAVAKDKQAVSQLATETAQNAQKAAESAQAAERSSTAAKEAQTAAENAGERATSAMEATEKDRTEVAENRKAVEQAKEAVAADRRAVENTALQFGQFAQSAINAVGQAQGAAVGAVSAEGQRQTTAVQQAGTQAVSDVTAAKTEAVQAVTTEGDTQTKRVQDAAAGIVADREQIAANKAGIEALHQSKADSIVETAQGETMTLTDSSDKLFRGLRVFGKSAQDGTPSVENPVPIVNAGENGSITVEVTGRNLLKPNSRNTYYEFPLKANTVITLMTNGKPSQGGNIKFSATDGSNVWFSIDAGQTRVCRSIGNKDVKGFYDLLSPDDGLEYMFAVGDIKTYTPYVEPQSLTLQTPNGLPGVPVSKDGNYTDADGQQWICDEIDLERGKYVQRVKDFIFNDKTNFSIDTSAKHENSILVDIKIEDASNRSTLSGNPLLCDKLKACREDIFATDEVSCGYTSGANFLRVRLPISAGTTKEGVKNYLTDKSFKILYILATPIERDLTPEELAAYSSLHTNYPTTVITNDAGAYMEASYVPDTGTYIRNMESRLNAKLVNIQSALISQKISGGGIKVTDSSRVPVVRFVMWGKTEQVRTSGAQLLPEQEISNYFITFAGDVVGKNTKDYSKIIQNTENTTYYIFRKNVGTRFRAAYVDAIPTGNTPCTGVVDDTKDNISITVPAGKVLIINMEDAKAFDGLMVQKTRGKLPYEPYSGGFPSPSPDWEQPIETTDQPVTITVKGGTEQQSITMTPPRPFTKWDKLEKVDGVWCWVYQHNEYTVTGEETFAIGNEAYVKGSSTNCYINGLKKAAKNKNEAMERLPRIDLIWSKPGDVGFALNESQLHMRLPNFLLGVSDDATASEKIAAYKAYVKAEYDKGTPYHVIYETTTPESIPISPSEQDKLNALTMYAGTTEVTNTGGCNMELTYTVDTKSYVDSKIAAISAAVLEV